MRHLRALSFGSLNLWHAYQSSKIDSPKQNVSPKGVSAVEAHPRLLFLLMGVGWTLTVLLLFAYFLRIF